MDVSGDSHWATKLSKFEAWLVEKSLWLAVVLGDDSIDGNPPNAVRGYRVWRYGGLSKSVVPPTQTGGVRRHPSEMSSLS